MRPHLIAVSALLILASGCLSSQTPGPAPPSRPFVEAGHPSTVKLQSGDELEIKFAYASRFDQIETVRPDGKIELQLLGEVVVCGKTPAGLRDELMRLYAAQLKHPQLVVIVKGFYERRVYVGGQVKTPGPVLMPGEMTALEAVMSAGGFIRETAEPGNVIVVRKIEGRMVGRLVDIKEALTARASNPFYLKPRDIVYVPEKRIVNADLWIQQHLWHLLPPLGIGATVY